MANSARNIVYPVKDLQAAKAIFNALLGTEPYVDSPYYVGYRPGGVEVGLAQAGQGMAGQALFFEVADIEQSLAGLGAVGAVTEQAPKNVGGGMLTATVRDPDGNVIGLAQVPASPEN